MSKYIKLLVFILLIVSVSAEIFCTVNNGTYNCYEKDGNNYMNYNDCFVTNNTLHCNSRYYYIDCDLSSDNLTCIKGRSFYYYFEIASIGYVISSFIYMLPQPVNNLLLQLLLSHYVVQKIH